MFVELPSGRLINAAAIRTFDPHRSNRIDYLDGSHEQLPTEAYAAVLKEALVPDASAPGPSVQETVGETATKRTRKTAKSK